MFNADQDFLKRFFKIAVPITLQMVVMSSLNMVDTIMVGQLGDTTIAAVGIANQLFFLMVLYLLGVRGSCSIFAAQFFGKKEHENVKKVVGLGMVVGLSVTSLYTLLMIFRAEPILSLFTKDQEVISIGAGYLTIVALSYVITTISAVYGAVLQGVGDTKLRMMTSIIAISINTVLNYIFIFGKLGLPAMGAQGAAMATVIARIIEMVLLLYVVYKKNSAAAAGFKHLFGFSKNLFKRFIKQSGLMMTKDVIWGLGMTVYVGIYAHIGTEAAAAANIMNTVNSITFILINGVAGSSMIMVGQKLGEDAYDEAYDYAMFFRNLVIVLSILIALVMYLGRNVIVMPFNVTDTVIGYVKDMVIIRAVFFVFFGFNNISIVGIMRSGGDTMFSLVMDLVAVWFIGLPFAYGLGIIAQLPLIWVVVGISVQEVFKTVLCHYRVTSKKWMNNLVSDIG